MSSYPGGHPGQDLLLLYFDRELPARQLRPLEEHLAACWQCRAEVEEFRKTAEDCVRYRGTVLASQQPPAPWRDLSRDFARIDSAVSGRPPYFRWALAAAASLLLAAGLFYHFRETPSVEAAALLRKAVAASVSSPAPHRQRHIRVRTRSRLARFEDAPEVRSMFVQARYPAEDPLAAASYQEWRDAQAVKTDEIETITAAEPPFDRCYRIRTVAAEGDLAAASLTLRTSDLHPVEGRFEFRNQEWVELTEIAETPGEETSLGAPFRRVVPSQPVLPEGSASLSDELAVVAALHGIGADLGDPLEINRSGERIVVSGIGIPPERRRQIEQALDSLPHVAVQFSDPAASTLPQEQRPAPGEVSSPVTEPAGLELRLREAWGGRAGFERTSAQLLEWNDSAMSRIYALRTLAQRFPAVREAAMNANDRAVLHDLARAHLAALSARAAAIEQALAPAIGNARPASPASAASWQAAVEDLFRAGRQADLLLSAVLGVSRDRAADPNLGSELLAAVTGVHSEIAACRKLVP